MNTHFKAFVTAALSVFLMTGLMAGCTDEPQQDVPDTPQEKPEPEKPGDKPGTEDPTPGDEVISAGDAGEVQYEIINPEGGDTGQEIGKPAVVEGAGDLQMSISQTSSYTDPDGTVFTCEPEARINVSVRLDTVYAKDFNELTELLEYVDPTYSEEGEEPVTHNIDQQFRFGEQTIDLDMDYEVYTYRNSLGQNIGMPYIELREADFGEGGGASAGEITRSSEAGRAMAVCRPSVTIRRAEPATRTIEVEDTAAYNVSVHFGVMVAPKNIAGAENKFEIVEFEVQYIGMVPHTDTYPGAELSYRVEDGEGNALEGSEFTVAPGSSFMLNVVQNSSYTDQDGALSANPVASVTVTTPDTLSIASADELPGLIDRVVFRTVSQSLEGKLPYCVLEDPVMDGEVTVSEEYMSEDGYVTVYKASARYIQEFSFVNVDVPSESPDEIKAFYYTVEYLGKVTNYPGAELSYRVEDGEGNALEGNEFTVAPGSSFMLNVVQNSSYTDQDGALSANPVAWTKITAPDTLSIDNAEELPALLDKVVIETGADELEGNLPYYRFETPVPDGEVSVAEVFRSGDGKTIVYKAAATYRQKAVPVNKDDAQELEFTYVVEYLGKVSVRLVDVTYDQDVIWEDAHHNIYTNSQCVVTKKATYSDGTVVESKFYSTKNFVQPVVTGTFRDTTGEIEDTNYGLTKNVNSFINHLATGVPDLEHFSYDVCVGDNEFVNWNDYTGTDYWCYLVAYEGPTGTWTEYKHQDTKELYSEAEQKEGCYGKQFGYRSLIPCEYIGDSYHPVRQYKIDLIYKDRFFCIDGRLFTFDPLEHKHSWSVETIETPNRGTCALHTLRADVTWLGRDFVYMVVDTVYVKQPSVATAAPASSSYPPRSSCTSYPTRSGISSRSGSPYVDAPEYQQNEAGGLTLSTGTLPGSAPYTEHTVIRPDGTRTTLRREGIVPDISFDVPGKK